MVKLYCDQEDSYVYFCRKKESYGTEIEVSEETAARWEQIRTAYFQMQQEIGYLVRAVEYEQDLPKYWWTILVLQPTSSLRYGFYGTDNQAKTELEKHNSANNKVYKDHSSKQEIAFYRREKAKELNIPLNEVD